MPIVASEIVEDRAQRDGRRAVREMHTDDAGGRHFVDYVAGAGDDTSAALAARVASIDASLVEREAQSLIDFLLAGNGLADFPFRDLGLQDGARRVLRYVRDLEDKRPALAYAVVVAGTEAWRVAYVLGVSQESAEGVIAWAQGCIDAIAAQDAASAFAAEALAEVG